MDALAYACIHLCGNCVMIISFKGKGNVDLWRYIWTPYNLNFIHISIWFQFTKWKICWFLNARPIYIRIAREYKQTVFYKKNCKFLIVCLQWSTSFFSVFVDMDCWTCCVKYHFSSMCVVCVCSITTFSVFTFFFCFFSLWAIRLFNYFSFNGLCVVRVIFIECIILLGWSLYRIYACVCVEHM